MVKLYLKLENLINKLLVFLLRLLTKALKKLLPTKLATKIKNRCRAMQEKIHQLNQKLAPKVKKGLDKAAATYHSVTKYPYRQKVKAASEGVKKKTVEVAKSDKARPKWILQWVLEWLKHISQRVNRWLQKQNPVYILLAFASFTLMTIVGLNSFLNQKESVKDKEARRREIANQRAHQIRQQFTRPNYYKRERLYMPLDKVNLPIYIRGATSLKALSVDFVIHASNRYTIKFLKEREHEVRDFINVNLAPVLPGFPIEQEGKQVLRHKLKSELNRYLKTKKIRGEIVKIYIQGIIAG